MNRGCSQRRPEDDNCRHCERLERERAGMDGVEFVAQATYGPCPICDKQITSGQVVVYKANRYLHKVCP